MNDITPRINTEEPGKVTVEWGEHDEHVVEVVVFEEGLPWSPSVFARFTGTAFSRAGGTPNGTVVHATRLGAASLMHGAPLAQQTLSFMVASLETCPKRPHCNRSDQALPVSRIRGETRRDTNAVRRNPLCVTCLECLA